MAGGADARADGRSVAGGCVSVFTPQALALFEERKRALQALAQDDPFRHPPNQRTWWDWEEIQRREREKHWLSEQDTRRMHKALCLAPTLEVFEELLKQRSTVPIERLDHEAVKAYGLR